MRRLSALALLLVLPVLRAEEGTWTFDNLPLKQLKEKYAFEPSQAWIEHVRLSTLTLGGCTGSFVSADGLVLTNHHCTRGSIQRLSTKERDLVKNGFVAMDRSQEIKIPGLTYRTLMSMDNVRLNFEAGAVEAIAMEAHRRKTGARALRGIVEELMLEAMYDLPSRRDVKTFTITRELVEQRSKAKVLPLAPTDREEQASA